MMEQLVYLAMGVAVVLGAACLSLWHDRLTHRGLTVRARVDAALRHALGGETFVAVEVEASLAWRRGRVVLSVPTEWDWLIRDAWDQVVDVLPAGYDLVVRGAHRLPIPSVARFVQVVPCLRVRPPGSQLS